MLCAALPLASWDSRAFWALTTKYIYHTGRFSPPAAAYHPHRDYPPLIPILQAWMCRISGKYSETAVKSVGVVSYIALTLFVFLRFGPVPAAIIAYFPGFWTATGGGIISGYADIPLGALYTVAIVSILDGRMLLGSLLLCLCVLCKREGLALYFIALFLYRGPACALPLIVWGVWMLMRPEAQPHEFSRDRWSWKKAALIAWYTLKYFFGDIKSYGIIWPLAIVRFHGFSPLLIIPLAYYACILAPAYMSLGSDLEVEFKGTNLPRTMFHVLPLLAIYIGGV
jgi:hypothetical protein